MLPRDRGVLDEAPPLPKRPHPCAFLLDFLPAIRVLLILERKKDGKAGPFHLLPQIFRPLSEAPNVSDSGIMSSNSGRRASRHQFGKGEDLPNPIGT
ncbi:hypothetical protein D8674_031600 [Pyrus ussuriensis x Pyrus communis]|uniref:Uncharacterized protein n=1 Tax=Pyrus ussuriensis x Pyrus communis TaxID=2448454 RepID=A0A5N5F4N4_9ROSA|nr:hypothetical protein D8674_031600 [Pyrus ussuriensis x Pyrus communis]